MSLEIILASSSPFRRQLLDRLHLDYSWQIPDVDETPLDGEPAPEYVRRLAHAKANKIAQLNPDAVVIGCDQCAVLDGLILGKPGNHDNALRQLRRAQGKTVMFQTAVCVLNLISGYEAAVTVPFEVEFRRLRDEQLDHYLRMEEPYQCAGSFKSEGYGITLFSALRGEDPTALIGLPLIALIPMLEAAGIDVV